MDDRKRAIVSDHNDEMSPPAKRHATDVKSAALSEPPVDPIKFGTEGSSWQVDLETYQKDALIRNLRELKREKVLLESQISEMERRGRSNADIIGFVEAYVDQFLDEVKVSTGKMQAIEVKRSESSVSALTSSSLPFSSGNETFHKHLASRVGAIKSVIEECLSNLPAASSDVRPLQQKLNEVLGQLKSERKQLDALRTEKDELQTGLESATERYLKAEKRIDRMKSAAVTNLERQGRKQSTAVSDQEQVNGESNLVAVVDSEAVQKAESARQEASAEASKRKEHIDKLEENNKKLTTELTSLSARINSLSDEDYSKTELFKASKTQHEDLMKRINHLEATHIQLREEAKKLRVERMAYRKEVDDEAQKATEESEQQLGRMDADLQRIRQERDSVQDKYNILKASRPEFRVAAEKQEQMNKAQEERIATLEAECSRLREATNGLGSTVDDQAGGDLDSLSNDALKARIGVLQKELDGLKSELPAMEAAYAKLHTLASKKTREFQDYEERIALLSAEKVKADQKFFGAMKSKDAREQQIRALQAQNGKTSALISRYQEEQSKYLEMTRNLEKQTAELQAAVDGMTYEKQTLHSTATDADSKAKSLEANVSELKKSLEGKDAALKNAEKAQRDAEIELEKMKLRLEEADKKTEDLRKKAKISPNAVIEDLKRAAYCTNCKINLKDTMLKTCNHVLCSACVKERIESRSRKCPHCLKPFGHNDVVSIHLLV